MRVTDPVITLRTLEASELEWASARYAEIGFQPATPAQLVLVAEVLDESGSPVRAGLGRLSPAEDGTAELSGIYVFPDFRARGIAARIVAELLRQSTHRLLYCLPFKHLIPFYARFGFTEIERNASLPCAIVKKLGLCDDRHPGDVGLMTRPITAGVRLRPGTLADCALLRRWDGEPHVIASDPDDDWEWETELAREPDWREQLMAELNGRPFGFVQIIDPLREETRYWGECEPDLRAIDIWIGEADCLGKGLGTEMMRQAIERCFADPSVTAIIIDPLASNVRAHKFYQRLGFVPEGLRMFFDHECLVHRLTRARWEVGRTAGEMR